MPSPLRLRRSENEAASPRRHITCTHRHCVDAARRRPLAVQMPPHRLRARSKLLGPPRFGRGAASRVAKTSPARIRKLMCVLTRRMPPAAARTTLLDPPQITPISIRQSNGRGECGNRRPRRGNTRQYAMNCNLGDILLRRPGDMPLLGRRQICNNTLCPCDVGCVIWSDFDHEGACVSFLHHDSNDTGSSGDRPAQPLSTPNTARFR